MAIFKTLAFPLLLTATLAAPAIASTDGQKSATVDYSDLDLSTQSGQKKLASRLNSAARTVCDTMRTESRIPTQEMRQCQDEAKQAAKRQYEQAIAQYQAQTRVVAGN